MKPGRGDKAQRARSLIGHAITAIAPAGGRDQRLKIRVGRRVAAVLRRRDVEELQLAEGAVIDSSLLDAMSERERLGEAMDEAMKLLARRRYSARAIGQRLESKGFEAPIVERAIERLGELALIDDQAAAREAIEALLRRGPAGPALIRDALERRGIDDRVIEREVSAAADRPGQETEVRRLIAERLKSMASIGPQAQARRLAALLARRGIDEEVAERLVREAVGLPD